MVAAFQPQIDLASGRIVAAEALCRWRHPEAGWIPPVEFIPVAEDAGFIDEIGRFMAEECCAALAELPIDVSVNVSPYQLESPSFTEWLADRLAAVETRGGALTLEITESRAIEDVAPVLRRLEPLRELGVGVALDDFGSGHASVTQLKRLHGTEVKLDRTLLADPTPQALEQMAEVVEVARSSGIRVVAEGIEAAADLDLARRLRCDRGQGYLIGRPMPREELERLVAAGR